MNPVRVSALTIIPYDPTLFINMRICTVRVL
jgi:hypothetical protein